MHGPCAGDKLRATCRVSGRSTSPPPAAAVSPRASRRVAEPETEDVEETPAGRTATERIRVRTTRRRKRDDGARHGGRGRAERCALNETRGAFAGEGGGPFRNGHDENDRKTSTADEKAARRKPREKRTATCNPRSRYASRAAGGRGGGGGPRGAREADGGGLRSRAGVGDTVVVDEQPRMTRGGCDVIAAAARTVARRARRRLRTAAAAAARETVPGGVRGRARRGQSSTAADGIYNQIAGRTAAQPYEPCTR